MIEKRPQLKQLLWGCKKNEFEVIVVHSLDRWSRNMRVTLETFKLLADHRIAFASITENIDYATPKGRLFIAMLGAFAKYFSDSLAKHVSKGMKQRDEAKSHTGIPCRRNTVRICDSAIAMMPESIQKRMNQMQLLSF